MARASRDNPERSPLESDTWRGVYSVNNQRQESVTQRNLRRVQLGRYQNVWDDAIGQEISELVVEGLQCQVFAEVIDAIREARQIESTEGDQAARERTHVSRAFGVSQRFSLSICMDLDAIFPPTSDLTSPQHMQHFTQHALRPHLHSRSFTMRLSQRTALVEALDSVECVLDNISISDTST